MTVLHNHQRYLHCFSSCSSTLTIQYSLIFGIDIDDEPVGSECREYFDGRLARLSLISSEDGLVQIQQHNYNRTMAPRVDEWKVFIIREGRIVSNHLELGSVFLFRSHSCEVSC